ncbi:MAG: (Fe-S)-binding protein [bacterium]|nr:(Fe-S)-binding protein [bacterium]
MYELRFNEDICKKCTTIDCLMKCQYMDLTLDRAKEEHNKMLRGEGSSILSDCVTCCGCEEYCPHNNHPFYFIVEQQEKRGINPVPIPVADAMVNVLEPTNEIREKKMTNHVINMCNFTVLEGTIRGSLFKDCSTFSGIDTFCHLMYTHFGRSSVVKERVPKVIENIEQYYLKKNNITELICYHDECYASYSKWAPAHGIAVPFKPIHILEFMYTRLLELKENITPLNLKVAYQRSCSSRLIPEVDIFVDKIFELIGVERVEREYDRENALCCGAALDVQQQFDLTEENQNKNIDDMKAHGGSHCVFSCPLCFFTLMGKQFKKGIMPILIPDLCLQALGE